MANSEGKRLRNLLIVPIIVALVSGSLLKLAIFSIDYMSLSEKELSYYVELPIKIENTSIEIEKIHTPVVYVSRVRVWNSGKIPIKNQIVCYILTSKNKDKNKNLQL